MLIGDVCKNTALTKKAIEYYVEQGLVSPSALPNGYRNFSTDDVETLNKIQVLRGLGIRIEDIKTVLADETGEALQKLAVQKELFLQNEQAKSKLLHKLESGIDYFDISTQLKFLEESKTITEKLLNAFPGYYGRFICLHFSRFLNITIKTEAQQSAYNKILSFLDNVPSFNLPKDLQDYFMENTNHIDTEHILKMTEQARKSIENPDDFLMDNKDFLEQYLAYKQSEEYKHSPALKLQTALKQFNSTSGYYDIFIPALKILSPSYAEYYKQLESANEKLLSNYPEIAGLN